MNLKEGESVVGRRLARIKVDEVPFSYIIRGAYPYTEATPHSVHESVSARR